MSTKRPPKREFKWRFARRAAPANNKLPNNFHMTLFHVCIWNFKHVFDIFNSGWKGAGRHTKSRELVYAIVHRRCVCYSSAYNYNSVSLINDEEVLRRLNNFVTSHQNPLRLSSVVRKDSENNHVSFMLLLSSNRVTSVTRLSLFSAANSRRRGSAPIRGRSSGIELIAKAPQL